MILLFLLYALSGFVSLAYQVAWLRIGVDLFGSTDLTFALVLANFIGGLGAGAFASHAIAERLARIEWLRHPLRQYGAVELGVSAAALLTLAAMSVPPDWLGAFPYRPDGRLFEPTAAYQLAKIVTATLCVFVPCFGMGVTFPLLCHAFRTDPRFPSALYAWNTLGACAGVLAAEFLLVPTLGHVRMFALLVVSSTLLGAFFLAAGDRLGLPAQEVFGDSNASGTGDRVIGVLLACAIASGLLAGALEADMFKRIKFAGIRTSTAMSFVSLWAVLAIFLGAAAVRLIPRLRWRHVQIAYVAALIVYALTSHYLYAIHTHVFAWLAPAHTQDVAANMRLFFPAGLVPLLAFMGAIVFPTLFLLSLLLPHVCNRIQGERRHLGLAYGLNTAAFCIGTIAFTWILPRVSIFYSLKLSLVVLAIGVAFVALLSEHGRLALWKPALAGVALLGGCWLTPSEFDRSMMIPRTPAAVEPVRAVRSDSSFTTFVVEHDGADLLYFDNVSLSSTSPRQQTYMGLMAHFPLLAQRDPRNVLLICYGVGNTAAAIATHDTVEHIDVAELSRNVILTAPEFAKWNQNVHEDPRVRFIHDDGRNFLALTDRRYDLITSEPPPPLHEGIDRLYSVEYYRDALAHLTPNGLMSQWVPVIQMPQETVDRAIASFLAVFPHALIFSGMREELILVGGSQPIDLREIEQRFGAEPRVVRHLDQLGVRDPQGLFARIVAGDVALRRDFARAHQISDTRNDLAHFFLDPGSPGVVAFDPQSVIAELRADGVASADELAGVLVHAGRLQNRAPGFPISSLRALRDTGRDGVAGLDVDWEAIRRIEADADRALERDQYAEARALLQRALAPFPEQPKILRKLSQVQLLLGNREDAIDTLARLVAIEPYDANAWFRLAALHEGGGDRAKAADCYRRALAVDAVQPLAALRFAWLLATAPEPGLRDGGEALRFAEQGRERLGEAHPEVLAVLAAAHAERGEFDEAVRWQRLAVARAPLARAADYQAGLALYEKRQPERAERAYPWVD
jgi:spermidine synthase